MKLQTLEGYRERGIEWLNEHEAKEVFREAGIPCPAETYVPADQFDDGRSFRQRLAAGEETPAPPVYLKAVSRAVTSVSDLGVVRRIETEEAIAPAVDRFLDVFDGMEPAIEGILVSEAIEGPYRELLVGGSIDPQFGQVVSVGIGGRLVEIYGDVEFRVLPVEEAEVERMLNHLDGAAILDRFRGMKPVDRQAVIETVIRLSRVLEAYPSIVETDINPLLVGPEEVVAADALIRLTPVEAPSH